MNFWKKNKGDTNESLIKGGHYILDFYGCDPHQLNNLSFWEKELPAAARAAGMDILHSHFHPFDPQGLTGFLLLSSSHISVHTWPEYNYVACDVFSCSRDEETAKAVEYLKGVIEHTKCEVVHVKRGFVTMEYLPSPVYATGEIENIKVLQKIAEITSPFQNIVVIDTAKFGRCMVIDGLVQTSEIDHIVYDQSILKPLKKTDRSLLILGGGDGYLAEEALKQNPDLEITIVDLDQEVVNYARKHLNQKVFDDPRVKLVIGDALNYMERCLETRHVRFDAIVSDLTDNPVGGGKQERELIKFYEKLFSLSHEILKENGWIGIQGGAAKVVKKYTNSAKIISPILEKIFGQIERKDILIPSFSEKNAFLYSEKIKQL